MGFLILFISAAIGYGVVSIPSRPPHSRRFDHNRGFWLIGMAGVGGGQAIFLPLIAWAISMYGWRMALVVFGIGLIVIGFLSMFFMDNEVKVSQSLPIRKIWVLVLEQNYIRLLEIKFLASSTAYIICGFTTAGIVKFILCHSQT